MKVVITGGAGFIGSNLVRHWRREHPADDVVVFDALTYAGSRSTIADLHGQPRFHFVQGDVTDPRAMDAATEGAGLVLHLAAETHNDRAIADPLTFVRTNVLGTAQVLQSCRKHDVPRLHHVSTDEVFGSLSLEGTGRFDETTPYGPRGPYSASKASADHLVRAWAETYGLRFTLSNCGNNLGPYQHPEKLIPTVITRLLSGGRVPLYGDGKNVRDWIHVADHCAAIDAIVQRGRVGSTYLVSAECEVANEEVVRRILALLGKDWSSVDRVADRPGHDRRYALDSRKLREELGWKPRLGFDDALAATVEWYQGHRDWWAPLVGAPS